MGKRGKLDSLFRPVSIAVIGASNSPQKVGNNILRNLIDNGYRGKLFPINLKETMVLGLKAFTSVLSIAEKIDLAIIAIPSPYVPKAIEDCGKKKIPHAIIISAGFSEVGKQGFELQKEVIRAASKYDIRLLGPNCLGLINLTDNMNASFSSIIPKKGEIGFISQSGALCSSILSLSVDENFGFSKFISVGNKIDIDECELLDYLGDDPATKVVLMYLESINNGRRFMEVASRVSMKKPIVLVKAGSTDAGARAVNSHTGALAGEDKVLDAALSQCGIIRVNCLNDLFDAAEIFSKFSSLKNNKLAIVTNGGGLGVITIDNCVSCKIPMANISEDTKAKIAAMLPCGGQIGNPVDIVGDADAERFKSAIKVLLGDKEVGIVMVIVTPQSMTEIVETAEAIIELSKATTKPIITNFIGKEKKMRLAQEILNDSGLANFEFPEMAVNALRMLNLYNLHLKGKQNTSRAMGFDKRRASRIIARAKSERRTQLTLEEGFSLLGLYPLTIPHQIFSNRLSDHIKFLQNERLIVLKVDSSDVVHKTEFKMVSPKITSKEALEAEFNRLLGAASACSKNYKICAQGFALGHEIIVGGIRDPSMGPVVTFGIGGTMTELLKDVKFAIPPLNDSQIEKMIKQLKGYKILEGYRNMLPADIKGIVRAVQVISSLLLGIPEISEIEINPLFSGPRRVVPVDIRVSLSY